MTTSSPMVAFREDATLYPGWSLWLRRCQTIFAFAGAVAALALHSQHQLPAELRTALGALVLFAVIFAAAVFAVRYQWSRKRVTFFAQNRVDLGLTGLWLAGMLVISLVAIALPQGPMARDWGLALFRWTELIALLRAMSEASDLIHLTAQAGLNPALVLVLSFMTLIAAGTVLLMLPRCRPEGEAAAPFLKALFTATSAGCVTGLVLDPPGQYWSRTGQVVILLLIQLGGLGIMTFSAFFAAVLGRRLPVREQITFRELLDSDRMGDVGGMIRSILMLTFSLELIGAALLWSLWPELPWPERLFYAVFHAVSAFCNAGFCLNSSGLVGLELHWQVWAVIAGLIILGGLGFNVIDNWRRVLLSRLEKTRDAFVSSSTGARPRISLSTRLVTITTVGLLFVGTLGVFLLELDNPQHPPGGLRQFANAWFQSVTFRTAGFNTVDHEQLRPATKMLAIVLMFIGASPGSTGGGVKTISLALMLITLLSVLRGRPAVETHGRMIPQEQVFRGLAIITLGLASLMLASFLLVVIENRPERLLDQLYEAASAFGTVGVSANLTPTLKPASQFVLIATMFLGRVGPLTLIVALAGNRRPRNYAYPEERLALG